MQDSARRRRILGRTQALMVVVSLIPLGVLFYITATFVFEPLMDQGREATVYSIAATLGFTALTVVLGYVLVRRDTVRTLDAIADGERRLDRLAKATEAIAAQDVPDAMRRTMLEQAAALVSAERAALWQREGDELKVAAVRGISEDRARRYPLPLGQGMVGQAAARSALLLNPEPTDTDRTWDDRVVAKTEGAIVVPVSVAGETVAVLDLRNKSGGGAFDHADAQLAEGIARQAAQFLRVADFREKIADFEGGTGHLIRALTDQRLCWPEHVANVGALCETLAGRLSLAEDKRRTLRLAVMVHDIGLVDVPKPQVGPPGGPVDHAALGADRMEKLSFWKDAAAIVRAHHEQMDGKGPLGMHGFAIPQAARILALAEYVDTVTNPQSPWGKKSVADVMQELRDPKDKRFDAAVVAAFLGEDKRGPMPEGFAETDQIAAMPPRSRPGTEIPQE
jgi:putative methionine-R-sulfoxide reductase with GAF domain